MKEYKILAINPGSGSLKLALFKNENPIFNETIYYKQKNFDNEYELAPKVELILQTLEKYNVALSDIDAFSARAGGLTSVNRWSLFNKRFSA